MGFEGLLSFVCERLRRILAGLGLVCRNFVGRSKSYCLRSSKILFSFALVVFTPSSGKSLDLSDFKSDFDFFAGGSGELNL